MLGFLAMMNNYEDRKLDNYKGEDSGLEVDTCAVTDSHEPYETGITHDAYNGGEWVIVEMYANAELAQEGHDRWVKKMTARKLPKQLKDVSTSMIANLAFGLGDESDRAMEKTTA